MIVARSPAHTPVPLCCSSPRRATEETTTSSLSVFLSFCILSLLLFYFYILALTWFSKIPLNRDNKYNLGATKIVGTRVHFCVPWYKRFSEIIFVVFIVFFVIGFFFLSIFLSVAGCIENLFLNVITEINFYY